MKSNSALSRKSYCLSIEGNSLLLTTTLKILQKNILSHQRLITIWSYKHTNTFLIVAHKMGHFNDHLLGKVSGSRDLQMSLNNNSSESIGSAQTILVGWLSKYFDFVWRSNLYPYDTTNCHFNHLRMRSPSLKKSLPCLLPPQNH